MSKNKKNKKRGVLRFNGVELGSLIIRSSARIPEFKLPSLPPAPSETQEVPATSEQGSPRTIRYQLIVDPIEVKIKTIVLP